MYYNKIIVVLLSIIFTLTFSKNSFAEDIEYKMYRCGTLGVLAACKSRHERHGAGADV